MGDRRLIRRDKTWIIFVITSYSIHYTKLYDLSIVREPRPDAIYNVDAQLLTDQEQIKLFLLEYQRHIHGSKIDVAGTYFASYNFV